MDPWNCLRKAVTGWVGAMVAAVVFAVPVRAGVVGPVEVDRVDLPAALGRSLPHNTLKLFRAAVDSEARRLYVTGILTPYLAVLDLDSGRWVASIDLELAQRGYKYLYADEVNHLVFVRDGSNGSLTRVNPETGAAERRIEVPAQAGAVLCDGERGLVYLLTPESPSLRAYREDTLELAWSSTEMGRGVNSMDRREIVAVSRFSAGETGSVTADMLQVDEQRHSCWVGRLELSTADGSPTGRRLPRGDRVLALDPERGLYWVA